MKPFTCYIILAALLLGSPVLLYSQVSVNTDGSAPSSKAMLDVKASDRGILIPRLTSSQRITIPGPPEGLLVYDTDLGAFCYYHAGAWTLNLNNSTGWSVNGNSGTNPATHFIGTTDNEPLLFRINNTPAGEIDGGFYNTSLGYQALMLSVGTGNTAFGCNSLLSNLGGNFNTAVGASSLRSNVNGTGNTATGNGALYTSTAGTYNTASGYYALFSNNTGSFNTAVGQHALYSNNAGYSNVAVGSRALYTNTTRSNLVAVGDSSLYRNGTNASGLFEAACNTALGSKTLYANTTGYRNTAVGTQALYSNTSGYGNNANGSFSLYSNTSGMNNTAEGYYALFANTTGVGNTAVGQGALDLNTNASSNVAIGKDALGNQSYSAAGAWYSDNVAVGVSALYANQPTSMTNGSQNTAIGNYSMYSNKTGNLNTAAGINSLYGNIDGFSNTAFGSGALKSNTMGSANVAIGGEALFHQSFNPGSTWAGCNVAVGSAALYYNQPSSVNNGNFNTATGHQALFYNSTGASNTANGAGALFNTTSGWQNTSVGAASLGTNSVGSYNTAVGYNTGPNANNYDNTTCIGIDATATGSNMVRIGNVFVGSIGGWQGWTNLSDKRFNGNTKEDVPGLDFITLLRPVTYRLDREKINEFSGVSERKRKLREENPGTEFPGGDKYSPVTTGFVAQEVEEAAKTIGYDFSGVDAPANDHDFYGLRYAEFVAPLVKAVQELKAENDALKARLDAMETLLKETKMKTLVLLAIMALSIDAFAQSGCPASRMFGQIPGSDGLICDATDLPGAGTPGIRPGRRSCKEAERKTARQRSLVSIEDSAWFWLLDTSGSGWNTYFKYVDDVYDVNNNLVSTIGQSWENNAWVNDSKYTFTYDPGNNETSRLQTTWEGGNWVNYLLLTYTYDISNNRLSYLRQSWNSGAWVNIRQYIFTYDAGNNLATRVMQNWSGDAWVNSRRYTATYDGNNNLAADLLENWNGGEWVNSFRYTYAYDTGNHQLSYLGQHWEDGAWVNSGQGTFTYDAAGNQTGHLEQIWVNQAWVNSFLGTYFYDARNNQVSFTEQNWGGSAWLNSIQGSFTYDADNFTLSRTGWYWNEDGTQLTDGDSTWYYFHTVLVGLNDLAETGGNISIGPNPCHGKFTIRSTESINSVEIYDLRGELLFADCEFRQGTPIDLSGLGPATCVVKINTANRTIIRKIIIR